MYFCIQAKPEQIRQDKKQPFVFLYRKHTAGDLRKAKRQQSARQPKAGKAHDKKPERIRLIVIQFFVFTSNRSKKRPCFFLGLKRPAKFRKTSRPTNTPHNRAPFLRFPSLTVQEIL
jgi:hypothetical protein